MTNIYYTAIEIDYPGSIRRSLRKGRAFYWRNADGKKFYFASGEEAARDMAQDIGYSFNEALVTLMKHGVAIEMSQEALDEAG